LNVGEKKKQFKGNFHEQKNRKKLNLKQKYVTSWGNKSISTASAQFSGMP
jgi:hypothetical protein